MYEISLGDFSVTSFLFWAALALISYILLYWIFDKTPKNLPPGPREWGTGWKMLKACWNDQLHELLANWARQSDCPIIYVKCFGQKLAFVNTAELCRRILTSEEFKLSVASRMLTFVPRVTMYNGKDLIFNKTDDIMKKKRRAFHQLIGLYGDGVEKFEILIQGEMERLFREIDQHENEDFDLSKALSRSIKIVIYIMCFGEPPSDLKTADILEKYDLTFNRLLGPEFDFFLSSCPLLAKIPGKFKTGLEKTLQTQKEAEEVSYYFAKKTYVPGQPRGIIDKLFDLQTKEGYEFFAEDEEQLRGFVMSLFFSSHITSRSSIMASFLCLLNNPHIMKNIQEEIDRVLGNRKPLVEDRASMPYTEAYILDLLRVITQMPISGIRQVTNDMKVDNMTIPKDTLLFTNHWFFQHNEKIWEDPWTVKPERFLNSNGQIMSADEPLRKQMLPFGVGMRSCPAEVFSKCRAFLYVTNMLQRYDLLPPANEELTPADFRSTPDCVKGFVRQIRPFKCRLRRRQKV